MTLWVSFIKITPPFNQNPNWATLALHDSIRLCSTNTLYICIRNSVSLPLQPYLESCAQLLVQYLPDETQGSTFLWFHYSSKSLNIFCQLSLEHSTWEERRLWDIHNGMLQCSLFISILLQTELQDH